MSRARTLPLAARSLAVSALTAALLLGCSARGAAPAAAPHVSSTAAMTPLPAGEASGTPAPPAAQASPTRSPQPSPGPLATGSPRAAIAPQPPSPLPPRTDRSGFVVALDPGHGGDESGAAANGVVERDSNLDLAMRVGEFLKTAGVQVYYTRTDGGRAPGIGGNGDTRSLTRNDLQARVTAANRAGADVFVSLHSNGAADTSLRGVEVYYESRRPFADQNYRLAQNLIDGALRGLANSGNPSVNRGIIDAACWRNFQGRCVGLFVLSPGGTTTGSGGSTGQVKEATNMPAALLETLFVSSPEDAALLRDDAVRTAVARGIAEGILRFLGVLA